MAAMGNFRADWNGAMAAAVIVSLASERPAAHSHRQTQPAKSGGLGGRVGCGGRLTRTVGTLIFGGRGGRCSFGTWFQGMAVPP